MWFLVIFCCCYYFFDYGVSYSRLFSNVDQVVRLLFLAKLVLVLLPMLVDYFTGCIRACNLGTAAQNYGRIFDVIYRSMIDIYIIILLILRLCPGIRKSLKSLKIFFFRFFFFKDTF
jgi:hypothetical protein